MRILLNILQSQAGWFALVLSAAAGHAWIGISIALALIALHVYAVASDRLRELTLILAAGAIGAAGDTLLGQFGFIRFPAAASAVAVSISPLWMIVLWMMFATTLRHSLAWLKMRPIAAALLGAVAGPLAYAAGAALGALELTDPMRSSVAIAALWLLALPALTVIAHQRGTVSPLAART
jgi:hypothetical protein